MKSSTIHGSVPHEGMGAGEGRWKRDLAMNGSSPNEVVLPDVHGYAQIPRGARLQASGQRSESMEGVRSVVLVDQGRAIVRGPAIQPIPGPAAQGLDIPTSPARVPPRTCDGSPREPGAAIDLSDTFQPLRPARPGTIVHLVGGQTRGRIVGMVTMISRVLHGRRRLATSSSHAAAALRAVPPDGTHPRATYAALAP